MILENKVKIKELLQIVLKLRRDNYHVVEYKGSISVQIQKYRKTYTFLLLYIKARDARRITTAEMKYMRRTAGYTWTDYKTNTQITKELKITPILDKLVE